jgi:predicted GIY-YIG superfamily endonuclease
LVKRISQHREGTMPGFTKRYGCKLLVWCEQFGEMLDAIAREKQIKAGSREKKIEFDRSDECRLKGPNVRDET